VTPKNLRGFLSNLTKPGRMFGLQDKLNTPDLTDSFSVLGLDWRGWLYPKRTDENKWIVEDKSDKKWVMIYDEKDSRLLIYSDEPKPSNLVTPALPVRKNYFGTEALSVCRDIWMVRSEYGQAGRLYASDCGGFRANLLDVPPMTSFFTNVNDPNSQIMHIFNSSPWSIEPFLEWLIPDSHKLEENVVGLDSRAHGGGATSEVTIDKAVMETDLLVAKRKHLADAERGLKRLKPEGLDPGIYDTEKRILSSKVEKLRKDVGPRRKRKVKN